MMRRPARTGATIEVLFTEVATVFFDSHLVFFEDLTNRWTNSALLLLDIPGATGGCS
jgi:hypothetical protein